MADRTRVAAFIDVFAPHAIRYEKQPFRLRSGTDSNWYIDSREGLSSGELLEEAARLLLESAENRKYKYDVVAGMGVAGTALADAIGLLDHSLIVHGNDSKSPNQRYGYGLHGARVEDKTVWLVDDVAMSGSSLINLLALVRGEGGEVKHADALIDRSGGRVARVLGTLSVDFNTLLTFSEKNGLLRPASE